MRSVFHSIESQSPVDTNVDFNTRKLAQRDLYPCERRLQCTVDARVILDDYKVAHLRALLSPVSSSHETMIATIVLAHKSAQVSL